MKQLNNFSIGETVWFKYHTGKVMTGTIAKLSDKDKDGLTATILTQEMGFRTVLLGCCAKTKSELN